MHPAGKLYVPGAEAIISNLQRLTTFAVQHGIPIVASTGGRSRIQPIPTPLPRRHVWTEKGRGYALPVALHHSKPQDRFAREPRLLSGDHPRKADRRRVHESQHRFSPETAGLPRDHSLRRGHRNLRRSRGPRPDPARLPCSLGRGRHPSPRFAPSASDVAGNARPGSRNSGLRQAQPSHGTYNFRGPYFMQSGFPRHAQFGTYSSKPAHRS